MPKAVVLGGNGQVGAAVAHRLVSSGWDVTCSGRAATRFPQHLGAAGVRFAQSDRYDQSELDALLRHGADVVVDCIGYTAEHARMLLAHRSDLGSLVFISSKAVYVDDRDATRTPTSRRSSRVRCPRGSQR